MNSPHDHQHCIDVCNRLLRGELSAVETYGQVIEKYADEPEVGRLNQIRNDHAWAADRLQFNVQEMGGRPETDSGAWGTFSKALQGAANLFGEKSAVCTLEQGEKHGQKDYKDALDDDEVMPDCKRMIREELLPKTEQHIATLEALGKQ